MSSTWGETVKISIFGESHGIAIGVVIDGLPAGEPVDMEAVVAQMKRRAPGQDKSATPRRESDYPKVLSGLLNHTTTGAPLCAMIENTNTQSQDYGNLLNVPRPGHSDYPAYLHYHGFNDIRGGGHFSGRLTAPLVFAGAVCRQILARRGIRIGGHVASIAQIRDTPFDPIDIPDELLERLSNAYFPVIDAERKKEMADWIEEARMAQDSAGGVVECAVTGLPAGIGGPLFGGVEPILASILFGIPAVKGVEFGDGFGSCMLHGSQNNDPYYYDAQGKVKTRTNHAGGILGGMTTGMPLVFRVGVKPTASISQNQESINLQSGEDQVLSVHGRHDPCIVPRAVPVVEAAAAVALLNFDGILTEGKMEGGWRA